MQYEKIQKYFIRAMFKSNEANDINTLKTVFKNKFNISLSLSYKQIYFEKHIAYGTTNNLNIYELCNKLSSDDIKINVNCIDIFYDFKKKRKSKKEKKKLLF